jgi:NADP-dependent alcohol dehydrogenase
MNDFEYHNPVRIVLGKGTIARLGDLVLPSEKVMFLYGGGSIKKNGVYAQVTDALARHKVVEFAGIEPNPHYETCMKAVEMAKQDGVDFLLAVGGGSVLDGAKFIAAAMTYEGKDPWKILTSHGTVVNSAMPLGTILTLPATGSEMNINSVISRESTDEKLAFSSPHVYPRFSILDPEVTYTLPRNQLRNGLVDAFVHVMEQYATHSVNSPLQDRQAEAVVRTLIEIAPDVLAEKPDFDARASFMWCTTQALNGLIGCGVVQDWTTHMIGHELTAFFGVAHAESLAIVLPGVWEHQFYNKQGKLAQLARRTWHVTSGDETAQAKAGIEKTEAFFHSVDMPTRLGDYGIDEAGIRKVVDRLAKRKVLLGEHQNINAQEVGAILESRL